MIRCSDSVNAIAKLRGDAVCVTTMTQSRYWNKASQRPDLDIGISNGMSKASSVGFGIALGRPDRKVIVLDGDGSLLMNLGSLVTVAGKKPANFYHFVFDNGVYAVTGGQPVPHRADFKGLALASGYRAAYGFDDLEAFTTDLARIMREPGPVLVNLKTVPEPAVHGVDQTWESNARMPRQMRVVQSSLAKEKR
jgi:thiamine pyrophosphate-dependent acetolactate synthase large subunit-like protein